MKEVNIINEKKYFIVPGILLFLISFLDGLYQFNVISYASLIYLLIAALVLCLGIIGIRGARTIMYVLLCYHILSIWYPSFYSMLFPYNNMEEDIIWAVYDFISLFMIFVLSLVVILVLYFLNHFLWKVRTLWLCNMIIGSLIIMEITVLIFGMIKGLVLQSFVKAGLWIAAFLVLWRLTRGDSGLASKKSKILLAVFIFLVPGIISGILLLSKNNVKPKVKEYQGKDFSYLAVATDVSGYIGMINEWGDEVIPCKFTSIEKTKACKDGLFILAYNDTGEYLMNDKGKILADQYDSYTFLEQSDLVLISMYDESGEKCGAVNVNGELVIPLKYDSIEKLCETEGLDDTKIMGTDRRKTVYETDDLEVIEKNEKKGVIRKDGKVILPLKYYSVFLTDTNPVYICAGQAVVHNENEIMIDNALFDQNGKELIPFENHSIIINNENGWIQVNNREKNIYFLNQNLEKVLNLGDQYKSVGVFMKTRK